MTIEARKLELIHLILQSEEAVLDQVSAILDDSLHLSETHKKILDERLAEHEKNPSSGVDWKTTKAELLR